jgi:hypothetical protein
MKTNQVQALLAALEGICGNSDAQKALRKLSTLFEQYGNQDIKSVVKLIAQARTVAGLQR